MVMKWEVQKDSFDMEVERRLEDQDVKFGGGGSDTLDLQIPLW